MKALFLFLALTFNMGFLIASELWLAEIKTPTDAEIVKYNGCVPANVQTVGYLKKDVPIFKRTLQKNIFSDGISTGTEITIPDDAKLMCISVKRDGWDDKGNGINVLRVMSDFFDGDKWWLAKANSGGLGGLTTDGGVRLDECGNPRLEDFNSTDIPAGRGRKIIIYIETKQVLSSEVAVYFR